MTENPCQLLLLLCFCNWDMYMTPSAVIDCGYMEYSVFTGAMTVNSSHHWTNHYPVWEHWPNMSYARVGLWVPQTAPPSWAYMGDKSTLLLSHLTMDGESSILTSQTTKMVTGYRWDLFTHKVTVVKSTWWPLLSFAVPHFPHSIPLPPPC